MIEKVQYIQNFNYKTLSWNEVLSNLEVSFLQNDEVKSKDLGFFVGHNAHYILNLQPILEDLGCSIAHSYINITSKGKTFGEHTDKQDVWYWQCQGITEWTIEQKQIYTLYPGDLIYVPTGVLHSAKPLTPRIGISMTRDFYN